MSRHSGTFSASASAFELATFGARVAGAIDASFAGVTVALVDIPVMATCVGTFITANLTLASGAGAIRGGFAVLPNYE